MFRKSLAAFALTLVAAISLGAAETPEAAEQKSVVPQPEPATIQTAKPRIAVYDFTTIDIQGQHLNYFTDQKIKIRPFESLTDADRETVDEVMLGYIKMIEAKEMSETHRDERLRADMENDRNLALQKNLADKLLKTKIRPVVIGAQYMEAALGECENVEVTNRDTIEKAFADMAKLQSGEFPGAELAKISGATHVLYATVADMRVQKRAFSGYKVNTQAVIYSLDLLVKVVDINTSQVVFSRLVTGSIRELNTEFLKQIDTDRFGSLMKQAVSAAAKEIDRHFDKDQKNN